MRYMNLLADFILQQRKLVFFQHYIIERCNNFFSEMYALMCYTPMQILHVKRWCNPIKEEDQWNSWSDGL